MKFTFEFSFSYEFIVNYFDFEIKFLSCFVVTFTVKFILVPIVDPFALGDELENPNYQDLFGKSFISPLPPSVITLPDDEQVSCERFVF